jgi:hypothetical protein
LTSFRGGEEASPHSGMEHFSMLLPFLNRFFHFSPFFLNRRHFTEILQLPFVSVFFSLPPNHNPVPMRLYRNAMHGAGYIWSEAVVREAERIVCAFPDDRLCDDEQHLITTLLLDLWFFS